MRPDQMAFAELTDDTVTIAGEIDLLTAPALKRVIDGMDSGPARFDLSRVTFIDSTGLHLLIDLRRKLGPLKIVAESPAVERLLAVTGIRSLLVSPAVFAGRAQ
jgi:anti-sigma B factor antagonist